MAEEMVHKVTLSSGKVVLLREYKIRHQRLAAQAAASKSGDNPNVLAMMMAEEILKLLIFRVDDKQPTPAELEDLDSLITTSEYGELQTAVGQLSGGNVQAPKMEFVSYGAQ